jgi:hypothetical protein
MGLEHLDLYIVAYLTNLVAALVGGVFVLLAWVRPFVSMKRGDTGRREYSALLSLTAAVLSPPIVLGIFYLLPYSMKDRYLFGIQVGVLDLLACSSVTVLLVITTLVVVTRESSVSKSIVKIGATVLLVIYACGLGVFMKFLVS